MTIITIVTLVGALLVSFSSVSLSVKLLAISVAVGVVVLGFFRDLPKPKFLNVVKSRHWFVIALTIFLLAINVLVRVNEHVWDVSQSRLYSLRQESIDWINKLNAPVKIHVFLRSDDKTYNYINWLRNSAQKLGNKVDIQVHNINRDIDLADRYGVTRVGEVVLESDSHWIKIGDFKEASIVRGLARLFGREGRAICFVAEHGEADVTDESPSGLSFVADALKGLGYSVRSINLLTVSNVESQCSLVVVMGAASDMFPAEIATIADFFGKVPMLVAVGPSKIDTLVGFLRERGLNMGQRTLLDNDNLARRVPLTDLLINLNEAGWGSLFLPKTQSLTIVPSANGQWQSLLTTPLQHDVRDDDGNAGPFTVVAAYRHSNTYKAVVIGSARPFLNVNWRYANNAGFFIQMINMLLNESEIALPEYGLVDEPIMDMTEYQATWIKNVVMYVFPGLVLLLCAAIWTIHRRTS